MAILFPPITTEADVHAVRALITGQATPDQQQRAMRWIGDQVCRRLDSPYASGADPTDQGVLLGRHLVGVLISDMTLPRTLEAARKADAERAGAGASIQPPRVPVQPRINRKRRDE